MKLTALLTAALALSPALLHAQPLTAAAASDTTGNAPSASPPALFRRA